MALNLIYGKAGSGKTTYLFEKVKEKIEDTKRIYIITPEQFSFTAEKRLLDEIGSGAVINAEVLTFSRMAYRVINENGNNLKNIEDFGKSMLFYDILDKSKNELTFLGKNLQNTEIVSRSITEFKKHNITDEKLLEIGDKVEDKSLKSKLLDLSLIYTKFQNAIKDRFLDENDSLVFLAENLKNAEEFKNSVIFIDEFARVYSPRI